MQYSADSGPAISVVICTYNRADLLDAAIQSVCEQTLDKSLYELIVVDSNSKDNTRAVVKEFGSRYPNIRYFSETQLGLSRARNRGWREAVGEYVAYIDDDCRVPEEWLATASEIIEQVSPGAFGGPIHPSFDLSRPRWFKDSYGMHQPFDEAQFLRSEQECTRIFGGNAFFRREVLQRLGGFDPKISMFGPKISFGEDTAVLKMMHTTMPEEPIYYDPRLHVYHLIRAETMTWRYNIPASFEAGRVLFRQNGHKSSPLGSRLQLVKQSLRTLGGLAIDLVHAVFQRDRRQYPYIQNYLYEHTLGYVRKLGSLYARLQSRSQRI
jgi:glycosyltransferase involved in cell wall biosynthesis